MNIKNLVYFSINDSIQNSFYDQCFNLIYDSTAVNFLKSIRVLFNPHDQTKNSINIALLETLKEFEFKN